MEGKLRGVNRETTARIRTLYEQSAECLRRARENASEDGEALVEFWLRCADFAIRWLDIGVAAADLGELLGTENLGTERLGTEPLGRVSGEQRERAVRAIDGLLRQSEDLIRTIVPDARHLGDLGQIASLNRYVLAYLRRLRSLVAG